jgi:predicted metal-dependent phosphoesterase TrpH
MLRGDFHMHTHFSHDCLTSPEALVQRAQDVGLTLIAVTDHNSVRGGLAAKKTASIPVIVGEEVKSTEGEITGLFLEDEVPAGLTPLETVKRIKQQGALVSVPHPFAGLGRSSMSRSAVEEILPYVDIVEAFNARTHARSINAEARAFAAERGIAVTAVSDAHTVGELGRAYTELLDFDGTPEGFKRALAGATLIERPASRFVHVASTVNKLRHRFRRTP